MQVLLLAFSIVLLTILAGKARFGSDAGNKVVMKVHKPKEKKATLAVPGDRLSVYTSRFDMIVN